MRNFDPKVAAEFKKESLSYFYMFELQLPTPVYYTDADHYVYYNSHNFAPLGFAFPDLTVDSTLAVDKITIDVDNTGLGFSSILLSQDVRNKVAILYIGVRYLVDGVGVIPVPTEVWDSNVIWSTDDSATWDSATSGDNSGMFSYSVEPLFRGIIDSWIIDGDVVCHITIANELILWNKKSLREHPASCSWIFGGSECTYAGYASSWCDQSYDRCAALSNSANFGGFRFLPSLLNKQIWWGKIPA
jgi:hypothetical protein